MKKYKILILSNMVGSGLLEDTILKNSFEKEGHFACLESVTYDENLDDEFDVIIRRNTWVSTSEDTVNLYKNNDKIIERLLKKGKKTVNLVGLDGKGKGYLCDLFKNYENVLPTIKCKDDIKLLPKAEKYVIKDIKSFGNGLHQRVVKEQELEKEYKNGDIVQPFMSFKAEVQCYYVAEKMMYAYEYTPSKYPHYPEPKLISLTEKEQKLADTFAKYSKTKYGLQRIDFLRLQDDSLVLMEIEDHAPFMNLSKLPENILNEFLSEYKASIYNLIEN
ncbi:MAG: hypothetical protein R3Y12_03540 [Clostridia bacterium]